MIKSKMFQIGTLCCLLFSGAQAFAETFTASSQQGRILTLRFPTDDITSSTTTATFCLSDVNGTAMALTSAKLWMPEHGHGSSPTSLTPMTSHCTEISNINFVMIGQWEIRIKLADFDTASFVFDVIGQ